MISVEWLRATFSRATALIEPNIHVLRKAVSFALVGVVNVLIDTTVFLLAYSYISASPWALRIRDLYFRGIPRSLEFIRPRAPCLRRPPRFEVAHARRHSHLRRSRLFRDLHPLHDCLRSPLRSSP